MCCFFFFLEKYNNMFVIAHTLITFSKRKLSENPLHKAQGPHGLHAAYPTEGTTQVIHLRPRGRCNLNYNNNQNGGKSPSRPNPAYSDSPSSKNYPVQEPPY